MTTAAPTLDRCCDFRGLFYAGREKRCYRHATPEQRVLVEELDQRDKALRITGPDGWPYGPNIDVESRRQLLDWAERYGVRQAGTRCQGLHWLKAGRCTEPLCQRLGHWMDHVTRWNRNGKPALLIAHPYSIGHDDIAQLGALAAIGGWRVWISAGGWYGHGTVSVEVWREDAYGQYIRSAS